MCFVKSSTQTVAPVPVEPEPIVERKEANASATKSSAANTQKAVNTQNIKTTPLGLSDEATVQRKTLLGE